MLRVEALTVPEYTKAAAFGDDRMIRAGPSRDKLSEARREVFVSEQSSRGGEHPRGKIQQGKSPSAVLTSLFSAT